MSLDRQAVLDALTAVYDPEIPVDIVNLGLVYDVSIEGGRVAVKMTTTAPGCPVGDYIARTAERAIARLEGVRDVKVQIVDDPPWTESMMTDAGKKLLGIT